MLYMVFITEIDRKMDPVLIARRPNSNQANWTLEVRRYPDCLMSATISPR